MRSQRYPMRQICLGLSYERSIYNNRTQLSDEMTQKAAPEHLAWAWLTMVTGVSRPCKDVRAGKSTTEWPPPTRARAWRRRTPHAHHQGVS
jgi:hypothetical protein